jgi:hypothetical protein
MQYASKPNKKGVPRDAFFYAFDLRSILVFVGGAAPRSSTRQQVIMAGYRVKPEAVGSPCRTYSQTSQRLQEIGAFLMLIGLAHNVR